MAFFSFIPAAVTERLALTVTDANMRNRAEFQSFQLPASSLYPSMCLFQRLTELTPRSELIAIPYERKWNGKHGQTQKSQ